MPALMAPAGGLTDAQKKSIWYMSEDEKSRYMAKFNDFDDQRRGFLDVNQMQGLFVKS